MPDLGSLADYPGLARWYASQAAQPDAVHAVGERLVLRTCEALRAGLRAGAPSWIGAFEEFLRTSEAPLADFLAAEETTQRCDADLLDLIGELGGAALAAGAAERFFAAMRRGADATGLVVLRFLSAWTALNSGDLAKCVEECEKVDEPYSHLYTIQGQALLELGRPKEAFEVLDVATRLAPGEILAWFQMAKALHVLGKEAQAFDALVECQRLAPQSEEIALFMAMIASGEPQPERRRVEHAWASLRPHLSRFRNLPDVTIRLIRLACQLGDKEKAREVIADATFDGAPRGSDVVAALADVLRRLHGQQWMDLAQQLLAKVVPQDPAA